MAGASFTEAIDQATVAVLPSTARRTLKIKKADPIVYRGVTLKCIGSKGWRNANGGKATDDD